MSERVGTTRVLDDVLAARRIAMAYQPVVDLVTREVVAFEALARPAGVPLDGLDGTDAVDGVDGVAAGGSDDHGIVGLLDQARGRGLLGELDWICRTSALAAPGIDDLPRTLAWFVNAEPASLLAPRPDDLVTDPARAGRVVLEVTERAVHAAPYDLLRGVARARAAGMRIALDDVGTDPRALALLALVAPDVVKLDASLVRHPDRPETLQVTDAVRAYAERAGAVVVVEGIEDAADVDTALTLGGTHGQGWFLGRPRVLPRQLTAPASPLTRRPPTGAMPVGVPDVTPFELLSRSRPTRWATRRLLIDMTRHLEEQVHQHREPLALLATFQQPDEMTDALVERYRRLSDHYAFLATFGPALPDLADEGVVRVDVASTDPLLSEWTVVVIGPHYCAALSARSVGRGRGMDEIFDHVVTHDRAEVERVTRVVVGRMAL